MNSLIALVSSTTVFLIAFLRQRQSLNNLKKDIESKNKLIEEENTLKQDIENKLAENLKGISNEQDRQRNIRVAMLNLLEDSKDLEKQLEVEKAGVEKKVIERTQELSDTKAKLDSSIENMPVGFFIIDISGKPLVVNGLAYKNLGAKNSEDAYEILKNILKEKVDIPDYLHNCDENSKTLAYRDIIMPDGRFLKISLAPVLSEDTEQQTKKCTGVVVLVDDITEVRVAERSKDEFFSIASHELRTPLTAIRGNTSMILEYYADAVKDPELRAMVDDVHDSSIRLINIVNDFLNVSRLEQGKMQYDIKEFDINKLIDETIKEYNVTGSRKKLSLNYQLPPKVSTLVLGDSDKVRQILINLVGNALKFTEKGGVTISLENDDKHAKVSVADTGRGIPATQQALLFHKFQQAGSSLFTRDTVGGTGLGLYISKMMIEGMKGEIKLEKSEEGKGTTFSISLPLAH